MFIPFWEFTFRNGFQYVNHSCLGVLFAEGSVDFSDKHPLFSRIGTVSLHGSFLESLGLIGSGRSLYCWKILALTLL